MNVFKLVHITQLKISQSVKITTSPEALPTIQLRTFEMKQFGCEYKMKDFKVLSSLIWKTVFGHAVISVFQSNSEVRNLK